MDSIYSRIYNILIDERFDNKIETNMITKDIINAIQDSIVDFINLENFGKLNIETDF